MIDIVLAAIANHSAVAVRDAAFRAMAGDHRRLDRLGLSAVTMVDLWAITQAGADRMTAAEIAADTVATNIALASAIGADKDII